MLNSGESYTVTGLFSENLQIQIPDMQRDYCWATTFSEINGKSLVVNFLNDLISGSENGSPMTQMGLIYAYESPKNNIQLCDGQQRLTTIYLILLVLYRDVKSESIYKVITYQDGEQIIPRFQYTIRDTTFAFLVDVLQSVFLTQKCNITEIKDSDWFFSEYENDPSIQNIIQALGDIESICDSGIDKKQLANFLLSKISFLYFDMINRTYGEEQFVVINTTGKPLTTTENIKPKLIGGLDDTIYLADFQGKTSLRYYADMWEEWENHFWQIGKKDELADTRLKEFFRWIFVIEKTNIDDTVLSDFTKLSDVQKALSSSPFTILDIKETNSDVLNTIHSYFLALKVLENDTDLRSLLTQEKPLSQIECLRILPLLTLVQLFNITDVNDESYVLLKRFLHNRSKDENVRKASISTVIYALKIPKILHQNKNSDLASLDLKNKHLSTMLFNNCEAFKLNVLRTADNRSDFSDCFWMAESLPTSNGNIEFIFQSLKVNISENDYAVDINKFKKTITLISLVFGPNRDLMRQALLTFDAYWSWDGHTPSYDATRYTFGNSAKFYGAIANNSDKDNVVLQLINEYFKRKGYGEVSEESVTNYLTELIKNFESTNDTVDSQIRNIFIKDIKYLKYMRKKYFFITYSNELYALQNTKVSSKNSVQFIMQLTIPEETT